MQIILQSFIIQTLALSLYAFGLRQTQTTPSQSNQWYDGLIYPKLYNTSTNGNAQFSKELNQEQLPTNTIEYGYGFWLRFLTTYPTRLLKGKSEDWYFMARLTIHKNYTDQGFGDNLLSLWQGQGYYYFSTCDSIDRDPNVHTQNYYPNDIEGLWTYIYFSHSQVLNRSVGFTKFGNQQGPGRIQLDVQHPQINYLKLIVGGKQFQYPGFNGQIQDIKFLVSGAFINDQKQFLENTGLVPNFDLKKFVQFNQVTQTTNIQAGLGDQVYQQIGGGQDAFPKEYSVSGWFKWTGPYEGTWHMVFRLTINDKNSNQDNKILGDQVLTVFVNKNEFLRGSTYTYTDMIGNGNADYLQDLQHQGIINEWHFIYFGYSKLESRAYFFLQTKDSLISQNYINANHYLVEQFYFQLRDSRYPNYNGQEALLNINLGHGAFSESKTNYWTNNDLFSYTLGLNQFFDIVTNSTVANQDQSTV